MLSKSPEKRPAALEIAKFIKAFLLSEKILNSKTEWLLPDWSFYKAVLKITACQPVWSSSSNIDEYLTGLSYMQRRWLSSSISHSGGFRGEALLTTNRKVWPPLVVWCLLVLLIITLKAGRLLFPAVWMSVQCDIFILSLVGEMHRMNLFIFLIVLSKSHCPSCVLHSICWCLFKDG